MMKAISLGFFSLVMVSCEKEDPSLLAELEKQAIEIEVKETRLSQLRKDVAEQRIDDPSEELAALQLKIDEVKAEVESTREDVKALKADKEKVEKEFSDYKSKYPIREEW